MKMLRPEPSQAVAPRKHFPPGSTGAAIECYLHSLEFQAKKPRTQYCYRIALDLLRDGLGTIQFADVDVDIIDIYSEKIAQKHGAALADRHVFLLSNIWQVCRKHPEFKIKGMPKPTTDATKRYKVVRPHAPWDDAAEELFMETAPPNLQLAKLLLHFSAQRGGDCVKMKWTDFDGHGLTVLPEKTSGPGRNVANYHLCPEPLRLALLAAPRTAETILVSSWGKPFACADTLSQSIRAHLKKIGLAEDGVATISMHGLRKTAACDLAELGVGAAGIGAVTGQSHNTALYYAKAHNKRTVNAATVAKWNEDLAAKKAARVAAMRAQIRRVK
jgi:integrase